MSNDTTEAMATTPAVEILYGLICFGCVVFGVPGNLFALRYFLSKRRDISSVIYTCITFVDVVICLTPIPVGISYFTGREPILFGNIVFCNMWAVTFRIVTSLSIFYVALLSITRTYYIIQPFKRLSLNAVKITILIHLLLQFFFVSIIYWEAGGYYIYAEEYVGCDGVSAELKKHELLYNVTSKITYTMPIFPIMISCVISTYTLVAKTRPNMNEKRYVSITIVLFTLLYAVFNIPQAAYNVIRPLVSTNLLAFDKVGYFANFIFTMSVPVNALLNPILYICRMTQMRNYLRKDITQRLPSVFTEAEPTEEMLMTRHGIDT